MRRLVVVLFLAVLLVGCTGGPSARTSPDQEIERTLKAFEKATNIFATGEADIGAAKVKVLGLPTFPLLNSRPLHPNKFTHFFLRHASLQAQPFKAIPHGHFITPFLVCVSIISLVDKKDTQKLK